MPNYVDITLSLEIESDPNDVEAVMREAHGLEAKKKFCTAVIDGDYHVGEPYDDD